ncbi:DUF4123 domain-containing protein [Lysobacter sp. GX 14042]|uniref:DUF4123 domain-containing protein n=1 Tax=Lysobacter sp. GX 14042 TaxID=2907155 RepID=UPI001F3A9BC5|nr:DUF4123 domain-containing protein [Lysobacter sp. GX 14042]MCE7032254.1 DUF4123 domain-containing protein [Lysobacter sp. GX 14042]
MPGLTHRLFLAQDYAVINPLQVGAEGYVGLAVVRVLPAGLERHERMMPLLAELRGLPEGRRMELLERAERWSNEHDLPLFSALLACPAEASRLVFHLRRRMVLRKPDGSSAWLRFHDPRVFRHLRWLLTPAQMAGLMGPVTAWTWYDPLRAQWHGHGRPPPDPHAGLSLSPAQWRSLEQLGALTRRLGELADEGGDTDDVVARRLLNELVEAGDRGLPGNVLEPQDKDAWR